MIKETSEGIQFEVKITPKSSKNEIIGWENNVLKIRIRAVPEKGEANEQLINFLAKKLEIAKSSIMILRGEISRLKLLKISGINKDTFLQKIK